MLRLFLLSLAVALTAAPAFAANQSTFQLWDLDTDKRVTMDEVERRLSLVFSQFDADGDGALDNVEYDAFDKWREAEAAEHGTNLSRRAVAGLSRGATDANFDGKVTRQELMTAGRKWFTSMDRNGDGQIDSQDFVTEF